MIRDAAGVIAIRPGQPAQRSAAPGPAPAPVGPAVPVPNPAIRIEPALNLVVLEFRDGSGEVARTIPSPREIDAYRLGQATEDQPAAPREAAGLDVTR